MFSYNHIDNMSKQKSNHFLSSKAKETIFNVSDTDTGLWVILGQNSKSYGCEPQHSGSSSTGEEGNWHIAVSQPIDEIN